MDRCGHETKYLVWTKWGNDGESFESGRTELREQCADCGRLLAGARRHSLAGRNTPWVDLGGLKLREQKRQEALRVQQEEWEERRRQYEADRQAHRERYRAYLLTPQWREKRELVIRHADGLCQGCGIQPAEQVHHLTYQNIGNEFLWELRAVCKDCHERVHSEDMGEA